MKHNAVMLVDDREVDNILHADKIKKADFANVVYQSNSADSALDLLRNLALISTKKENKLPAYIFVDLDMPVMDGIQFLEEFDKMDDFIKDSCRVVMLSATMNTDDIREARTNASLYKFLIKPLNIKDLLAL